MDCSGKMNKAIRFTLPIVHPIPPSRNPSAFSAILREKGEDAISYAIDIDTVTCARRVEDEHHHLLPFRLPIHHPLPKT